MPDSSIVSPVSLILPGHVVSQHGHSLIPQVKAFGSMVRQGLKSNVRYEQVMLEMVGKKLMTDEKYQIS